MSMIPADELDRLLDFVRLFLATYAETQHHPTAAEEAKVIAEAKAIRETWR